MVAPPVGMGEGVSTAGRLVLVLDGSSNPRVGMGKGEVRGR